MDSEKKMGVVMQKRKSGFYSVMTMSDSQLYDLAVSSSRNESSLISSGLELVCAAQVSPEHISDVSNYVRELRGRLERGEVFNAQKELDDYCAKLLSK